METRAIYTFTEIKCTYRDRVSRLNCFERVEESIRLLEFQASEDEKFFRELSRLRNSFDRKGWKCCDVFEARFLNVRASRASLPPVWPKCWWNHCRTAEISGQDDMHVERRKWEEGKGAPRSEYEGDKTRYAPWQCHPGLLSICLPVTFPYIIGTPPFPSTPHRAAWLPPSSTSTGELASSAYRHPANTRRIAAHTCRRAWVYAHTHGQASLVRERPPRWMPKQIYYVKVKPS